MTCVPSWGPFERPAVYRLLKADVIHSADRSGTAAVVAELGASPAAMLTAGARDGEAGGELRLLQLRMVVAPGGCGSLCMCGVPGGQLQTIAAPEIPARALTFQAIADFAGCRLASINCCSKPLPPSCLGLFVMASSMTKNADAKQHCFYTILPSGILATVFLAMATANCLQGSLRGQPQTCLRRHHALPALLLAYRAARATCPSSVACPQAAIGARQWSLSPVVAQAAIGGGTATSAAVVSEVRCFCSSHLSSSFSMDSCAGAWERVKGHSVVNCRWQQPVYMTRAVYIPSLNHHKSYVLPICMNC
jgi:hypothetical protein